MASDNYYYDGFDYHSSQNYFEIESQIDLFEIRLYAKAKRQNKQRTKIPSYPISRKTNTRKSQHPLVRVHGIKYTTVIETEPKIFRYTRHLQKKRKDDFISFACDKWLGTKVNGGESDELLQTNCTLDFNAFRQHFYRRNHKEIKSSLGNQSHIEIINIRLASISKSVQDDFMEHFRENRTFYPELVYHGTKLDNFPSILDYGFLIPNKAHPTNTKAPVITTANGSAYGAGVYSSKTADYSVSYSKDINTILVCAAVPKRNDAGNIERSHGNILVLSHVSEIIPLFLMDFRYTQGLYRNQRWFNQKYMFPSNIKQDQDRPLIISRRYLQKVLNYMKDEVGKRRRHRGRRNNRRKIRNEDEYQMRVFEPFIYE